MPRVEYDLQLIHADETGVRFATMSDAEGRANAGVHLAGLPLSLADTPVGTRYRLTLEEVGPPEEKAAPAEGNPA